ncbi:hypothetical protein NUW58_g7265 [Xylaria curta]|uniref:Uncharacterized protein n=1 Tax=Xylaria curta TaxID=42375 RepID=A0ACC1NKZ9_9PEZI|nr:hypothetical protein NUW58_g7265 [Xylaria curta]
MHEEFEERATANNGGYWLQHRFSCDVWEAPLGATAGDWIRGVNDPSLLLTPCQLRIIFAPLDLPAITTRDSFLALYRGLGVPSSFSLERVKSVSHSFGAISDSSSTRTWFHFLCKNISIVQEPGTSPRIAYNAGADAGSRRYGHPGRPPLPQADYSWLRSGYFLRTYENGCTTLACFGATLRVREQFEAFVRGDSVGDAIAEPYILLDLILDGLWREVDQQVWNMNDVLGPLEHRILVLANEPGQRLNSSKAQFAELHNLAKHIVYLCEALESCLLLIDGVRSEVSGRGSSSRNGSSSTSTTLTSGHLSTQLASSLIYRRSLFRSTKMRLDSMSKRIDNAINLAFNVVTLSDSMVMLQDSRVMKIIATITILFLPATAVATVIGSQLFLTEFEEDMCCVATKLDHALSSTLSCEQVVEYEFEMLVAHRFSPLAALVVLLQGTQAIPADYGSWAVNVTSSFAATGYRFGSASAEYSGAPGIFSHASWLYDAPMFNWTYTYTPPTFKTTRVDTGIGEQSITIWQNLTIDGNLVALTGTGSVTMESSIQLKYPINSCTASFEGPEYVDLEVLHTDVDADIDADAVATPATLDEGNIVQKIWRDWYRGAIVTSPLRNLRFSLIPENDLEHHVYDLMVATPAKRESNGEAGMAESSKR